MQRTSSCGKYRCDVLLHLSFLTVRAFENVLFVPFFLNSVNLQWTFWIQNISTKSKTQKTRKHGACFCNPWWSGFLVNLCMLSFSAIPWTFWTSLYFLFFTSPIFIYWVWSALLRYNLYISYIHLLLTYSLMIFSKFMQLCSHHHNPSLKYVCHSKKFPICL